MPRKGVKRAFLSYFIIFTTSPFQNPLSKTSQTFQELLHARDARAHRNANTFTVPFKTQLKVVSAAVSFTWWLRVDGRPRANAIGGPVNGNLRVAAGLFPSTFRIRPDCRSATSCSVSPSRPAPITTKTTRPSKQNMVGITNMTRVHHILKNMPKIMLLSGGGARSYGSFFAESDPVGSGKLMTEKVHPDGATLTSAAEPLKHVSQNRLAPTRRAF